LAWAGGVYYSLGYSPFDVVKASRAPEGQQSPQHDDIVRAVRQMAEDVRALKTKVDGKDVAQDAVPKNQVNSGQTTTGPTIADLSITVVISCERVLLGLGGLFARGTRQ
jgi:hypothetical protein